MAGLSVQANRTPTGVAAGGVLMNDHRMRDPDELVAVDLTDEQRQVLTNGLRQWGGPAQGTDTLAMALGWGGVADQHEQARRLCAALADGRPLTVRDWTRTLLATEVVFVSDIVGAGTEWQAVTGLDDEWTLGVLRELQTKLPLTRIESGSPS